MKKQLLRLAVLLALAVPVGADEGFWAFNAVPRDAILKRYGVRLTDGWLTHLQRSSVKFPNGSASFVSPDGLVLTNHHVAMTTIQKLSTPQRDLVEHGFLARTRAEELQAQDLELLVLQSIEDVTSRVNAAVKPEVPPAAALTARQAAIAAIEKESLASTGMRSEVVTLYQGGLYHLYRYKRYTDVRLVFAPEFDAAFYGGDPDNFTYPRYCLDMALFRIYENGAPLDTRANYLRVQPAGTKENDPVFTSGTPGATQRLNTMAHLEYLRTDGIPWILKQLESRRQAALTHAARGPEQERQAKDEIFTAENFLKSYRGQLEGLRDEKLMARKAAAEKALRAAVEQDPAMRARFGDAWAAIAAARASMPAYDDERILLENGVGFFSSHFSFARAIVRAAEERSKPDTDRLPEYTEARRAVLERQLFSTAPIYPEYEKAKLAGALTLLQSELGPEHAVTRQVLAGKAPGVRAAELIDGSKLHDVAVRKALAAADPAALAASDDAMIQLARSIDARARQLRKKYEAEVLGVEREAYAKIAQAVFATQGTAAYPDGTGTLRLSFGSVRSYRENGRRIEPFTTIDGLFARAASHGNKDPYEVPKRWQDAKPRLNLRTPYNFVTTNDIVGGNSGSPVVNARGELVGLVFDGNIQSLPGYFIYDEAVNRTVAVDVRGILEAMRVVYGAGDLVGEMTRR